MFTTLKNLFEHTSINVTLTLRNQLSNINMIKFESIFSYFMRITELKDKVRSSGEPIEYKELVMTKIIGIPPYWKYLIQIINGCTKFPKFDRLWVDCT